MSEIKRSLEYWDKWYQEHQDDEIKMDDWLDLFQPTIKTVDTPILDLGCGSGNDTLYLMNHGKKVISCDQSPTAIESLKKKIPNLYDTKCFNMLEGMPFDNETFELIIADLCLHYFNEKETKEIIKEIRRILKRNGHLAFRLNSINDINHGAGQGFEVEHHLYLTEKAGLKRFFDEEDIKYFFQDYEFEYLNEEVMTRYQLEKRLYRGLVRKKKD